MLFWIADVGNNNRLKIIYVKNKFLGMKEEH